MGATLFFASLLIATWLVQWLGGCVVGRIVGRIRAQWRMRLAQAGERRAEVLLRQRGFAILERNKPLTWQFTVNDQPTWVALRPDFVVQKGGRRWVADAKSGSKAPDLLYPPTRRQLLEYAHAFGATGVLLIDAEAQEIHTVCFAPAPAVDPERLRAQAVGAMTLTFASALMWAVWL